MQHFSGIHLLVLSQLLHAGVPSGLNEVVSYIDLKLQCMYCHSAKSWLCKVFFNAVTWTTPLFPHRIKSAFRFTTLSVCAAQSPAGSSDEGLELKRGHLRGSKACVTFREVLDAHQWHPLGRDGSRWEGATKVLLTCNLSEEGGWPCLHPLPLAKENIVFPTSNILFISNVIQLLLNSHLIHTCCIPFVPKSAWHYTINASASVKS